MTDSTATASSVDGTQANQSLTVRDNRTGVEYDVPIIDGTIKAADIGKIRTDEENPGLAVYDPGFVNTASCRSAVTYIDGDKGILEYRGYPIEQLAEKSNFLEVAYLLIHGDLPTKEQYDAWEHEITYHTFVHENVKGFMEGFRYDAHPMGMLMASVGALSTFYPESRNISDADNRHMQIVRMIAKMPTLGAWAFRNAQGKPYVYPDNELGYTENFLAMLFKMSETKFEADQRLVQRPRRAVHPARRPRAELLDQRGPVGRARARWTPTPRSPPASPRSTARCTAVPTRRCCGCCAGSAARTTSPTSSAG